MADIEGIQVISKYGIKTSIEAHPTLESAIKAYWWKTKVFIEDENFSWEFRYDMIFGFYKKEFAKAGIEIDWCDPDTSYEADVKAWFNALTSYLFDSD